MLKAVETFEEHIICILYWLLENTSKSLVGVQFLLDSYGNWTSWTSWSSCTVTCGGGTKSRARICEKETDDLECVGTASQSRECNNFSCFGEFIMMIMLRFVRSCSLYRFLSVFLLFGCATIVVIGQYYRADIFYSCAVILVHWPLLQILWYCLVGQLILCLVVQWLLCCIVVQYCCGVI